MAMTATIVVSNLPTCGNGCTVRDFKPLLDSEYFDLGDHVGDEVEKVPSLKWFRGEDHNRFYPHVRTSRQ
ncbi:hypothetical protein VTK56DRAFT_10229 [Thermocarpiscus australiensis]